MNTIQLTVCQPGIYVKNASQLCNLPSKQCLAQIKINVPAIKSLSLQERPSFGLQCLPVIRPRQPLPVCLAGGKEMMDNDEGKELSYVKVNAMQRDRIDVFWVVREHLHPPPFAEIILLFLKSCLILQAHQNKTKYVVHFNSGLLNFAKLFIPIGYTGMI
ncbi:hypothetical protein L6164_023478 [Bauhinia variegata]|uniref:Uncharacterized protein n=1 Tax=Bauhinia variegata TaxID=167791 RepID=A0ACB9MIG5_BAUVA|nr:hypothetical protein L6164_023478 [Bauhinia variegata]